MTSPLIDMALLLFIAEILVAIIAGALALLFHHGYYLHEEANSTLRFLTPVRSLLPALLEGVLNKTVYDSEAKMLGVIKDITWNSDGDPALVIANEDLQSSVLLPFSAERKVGEFVRILPEQRLMTAPTDFTSGIRLLHEMPKRFQIALFIEFGRSISGEEKRNLRTLAESTGLLASAEADCRSRLWWRRLHGLRLLSVLCAGEAVGFSMLSDKNPMVRAQAAEWAAEHPEPQIISRLLELLGDPESLCRFHVQDSLLRMGTTVVSPMVEYLNKHSGREVEEALKVCVGVPSPQFLNSALSLLNHENPAVRTLTAELLGSIGGDQAVEALRNLLKDSNAEVRANAASALGKLRNWSASSELAGMLGDSDWHVRRNAGYALRSVGAPGILVLRQSMKSENGLTAEMARAALEFSDIATEDQFN
jgi:hypothetical protein